MERRNEGPRIVVVTHKGARIGGDIMNKGMKTKQLVRKSVEPTPTFYPQQ
jgi:hypothetical protein